ARAAFVLALDCAAGGGRSPTLEVAFGSRYGLRARRTRERRAAGRRAARAEPRGSAARPRAFDPVRRRARHLHLGRAGATEPHGGRQGARDSAGHGRLALAPRTRRLRRRAATPAE